MPQSPSVPRPSDRWIPWYFVAFFVVLIATLVPMGIIAVRTNTGVVTSSPYEKGFAYNKSIAAESQQDALQWHGNLNIPSPSGDKLQVDFTLTDAAGKPLDGADVKFWLVRPAHAGVDQSIAMKPQSSGHYSAELTLPEHGLWEARVSATVKDRNYQTIKRVVIP